MTQATAEEKKMDGRTKAGRAARRAIRAPDQPTRRPGSSQREVEERLLAWTVARPDVAAALWSLECAQMKRDSVSRKLCAGSSAVTTTDLARCETMIGDAKTQLIQLAEEYPILWTHPRLAGCSNQTLID